MCIISVNLGDEHLAKADAIASLLSEFYGVPVSRSEIIRRAIIAFPMPAGSRTLSDTWATTIADRSSPADLPPLDPPPCES